jgi:class 3 adenylate cyclase
MTDLERLQRIAADIRELTSEKWPRVQLGIGVPEAMALLERLGATEKVYDYVGSPSIRALTLEIDGVSFTAQMEVAR